MTDLVSIWNMAITAAGSSGTIVDPQDTGREAELCRLWYPVILRVVQKAAPWPSVKAAARLAVRATRAENTEWDLTSPAPGWKYAYSTPEDMLAPRHLHNFQRFERVVFEESPHIMCDVENAILHYIKEETNTEKWDASLLLAIVSSLAASITIPLSGKDKRAERLSETAEYHVMQARTQAANEQDTRYEALPPWISVRGYDNPAQDTRFFYPFDDFNLLAA